MGTYLFYAACGHISLKSVFCLPRNMAVLSCLKYKTIPVPCMNYVHPWTDSCVDAWLGLGLHSFQHSLRTYATLYLVTTIMRRKKPSISLIKQTIAAIFQSTAFLTTHAYGFAVVLCTIRRLTGSFNTLTTAFIPCFLSSLVAIHIERPSRRPILCLYVTNVATETLFRMACDRGWVRPVTNGQVAIFAVSMTSLLYRFRGDHPKESMFGLIRFVMGSKEELCQPMGPAAVSDQPEPSSSRNVTKSKPRISLGLISKAVSMYRTLLKRAQAGPRAPCCPHQTSCLYYTLQGGLKMLAVGYGVQVALRTLLSLRKIYRKPSLLATNFVSKNVINLGAFLGLFSGTFRGVNCLLRHIRGKDSRTHAVPAGLLASLAFLFYPDNTAALYVMWKSLQIFYDESGLSIPFGLPILYCTAVAIVYHAALLEPTSLPSGYIRFLSEITGGRFVAMDRKAIGPLVPYAHAELEQVIRLHRLNPDPKYSLEVFGNVAPTFKKH